jgi:hypothetical protein
MFDVKDLIATGLLVQDQFAAHAVKDERDALFSPNQCLRAYGAEYTCMVRPFVMELEREGIVVSPDYVSMVAQAMRHQWEQTGRFPFDVERRPEPFDPHALPLVVRNALVRTHIPWETLEAMRDLVRRYNGDFLRAELAASGKEFYSDQVFADMLRAERQQPVVTRICINPGCGQLARTTLEQAVAAIEKYHLLPQPGQAWSGKLFTPHQRCLTCRSQGRREQPASQPRTARGPRRNRPARAFACLHDDPRARRALEGAAPAPPAAESSDAPSDVVASGVVLIPAQTTEA